MLSNSRYLNKALETIYLYRSTRTRSLSKIHTYYVFCIDRIRLKGILSCVATEHTRRKLSMTNTTVEKDVRISLKLRRKAYEDLQAIAEANDDSMKGVIKAALGLMQIYEAEREQGNKLAVISPDGKVLKELVLVR